MLTDREKALLRTFAQRLSQECYYSFDEIIPDLINDLIDKVYDEMIEEY